MKKIASLLVISVVVLLFSWLVVLSAPAGMLEPANPTMKTKMPTDTPEPGPTNTPDKPFTKEAPTDTPIPPTDPPATNTPDKPPTATEPEQPTNTPERTSYPTYTPVPSQTPGGSTATPEDTPPIPPTLTKIVVIVETEPPDKPEKPEKSPDPDPTAGIAPLSLPDTGHGPPPMSQAVSFIIALGGAVLILFLIIVWTSRRNL